MQLKDKVALVTGASQGIGAEVARQFAAAGASLYLTAHDTLDRLDAVAAECRERNPSVSVRVESRNLLDDDAPEAMVAAAVEAMGGVDILVNNAAIRVRRPFGAFSAREFDDVVGVNLRAPFLIGQAVVPVMKEAGAGRIVNIASQMGLIAEQDLALYGLTKAALIHLTMSMAFELAPFNIMVNAVSPGPTMTEYNRERTAQHPEYLQHKLAHLRTGRYSRPDEIAEAVLFLAGTAATNIQGHNLVVDGGYVIQ